VARIFDPGCRVDTVLVLEGFQGKKKSSLLAALASKDWFTDQIPDLRKKDAGIQLEGKWIVEFSELTALEGPSTEKVKSWVSQTVDDYRPLWSKHNDVFPRHTVFVGTTNKNQYLHDETGGRRYWPVVTDVINVDMMTEDRDQLWAEAVARYKPDERYHERHWIDDTEPELEALVKAEQLARYQGDPWDRKIEVWLQSRPAMPRDSWVSTSMTDILSLCIRKEVGDWTRQDEMKVARALRVAGWERYLANPDTFGHREWRYRPARRGMGV
jgi:predicted P-loop ATPase